MHCILPLLFRKEILYILFVSILPTDNYVYDSILTVYIADLLMHITKFYLFHLAESFKSCSGTQTQVFCFDHTFPILQRSNENDKC